MHAVPPSNEIFPKAPLVQRHPTILNGSRVDWALRNRDKNGLKEAGAVYESKSGELLIHEPTFLLWFLGLNGRAKPRALRRKRRAQLGAAG
jgi:hypothetical protein